MGRMSSMQVAHSLRLRVFGKHIRGEHFRPVESHDIGEKRCQICATPHLAQKHGPLKKRRVLKRYEKAPPEKGYVLFETGYGPSGCPIGTFGEVARTTMIMRAFREICDIPEIDLFFDDLDGIRCRATFQTSELASICKNPDICSRSIWGIRKAITTTRCCDASLILLGLNTNFIPRPSFIILAFLTRCCCGNYDEITKAMLKSLREERRQTILFSCPSIPKWAVFCMFR